MRRALSGQSGTTIGLDYRGVTVLAAHEPVSILDLGIVAKIDLVEIRAPFLKAAAIVAVIATVLIALGTVLFFRVGNPIIRRIQESEEKFRQILESAADAIIISDERGRILITNGQAEQLFGYTRRELIGQPVELLVPEGLRDQHVAERRDYYGHLTPRPMGAELELFARRKDGTLLPVDISLSPVHSEQGLMITAIVHDITARMHTEARLRHLNRTYAVLSRCNRDLARATDEVELLSAFCLTMVEVGGYSFACVGYAQQDKAKGVRLMAYAGHTDDEFSVIATGWSDMAAPHSPGGTTILSGESVILRDIEKDPRFPLWRDTALRQGYRSMIALPLRSDNQVLGDFSMYSTERAAFDEEDVGLLTELAGDLRGSPCRPSIWG
jgi:PAS domain S-box-containing protein